MDKLREIVSAEVRKYAGSGRGAHLRLFPILDELRQIYVVTAVDNPRTDDSAAVVVLARIVGDKVIIEDDNTDKQLVDALLQQGVPREQIILAYAGEAVPDPVSED
jgi:hypothetical protein